MRIKMASFAKRKQASRHTNLISEESGINAIEGKHGCVYATACTLAVIDYCESHLENGSQEITAQVSPVICLEQPLYVQAYNTSLQAAC